MPLKLKKSLLVKKLNGQKTLSITTYKVEEFRYAKNLIKRSKSSAYIDLKRYVKNKLNNKKIKCKFLDSLGDNEDFFPTSLISKGKVVYSPLKMGKFFDQFSEKKFRESKSNL